jgi:hypothetical protein
MSFSKCRAMHCSNRSSQKPGILQSAPRRTPRHLPLWIDYVARDLLSEVARLCACGCGPATASLVLRTTTYNCHLLARALETFRTADRTLRRPGALAVRPFAGGASLGETSSVVVVGGPATPDTLLVDCQDYPLALRLSAGCDSVRPPMPSVPVIHTN